MKIELLEDLYAQQLAELHDGEKQLARMLSKMAKAVSTDELRQVFKQHAKETKAQAERLEQLLSRRSTKVEARKSKAMAGLLAEAKDLLKQEVADQQLLEAGLVAAAQKVEAYEIASYACVQSYAKLMSLREDLEALDQTLQEENRMEDRLTAIGEGLSLEAAETETEIASASQAAT